MVECVLSLQRPTRAATRYTYFVWIPVRVGLEKSLHIQNLRCNCVIHKYFVSWLPYLTGMDREVELRHLRYFVAVAEAGSLTVAAEKLLHTAQPSLSRQIRDLENDVGTQLLIRNARGIELTAAGKAFLDHARLALIQVDAASEAARRAAKPNKPTFAVGFLTGQEIDWLPEVMRVLRDELSRINVTVSSQSSSHDLGEDLGRI
jgi:LysR family transcriptional regulator, hca operon transcriptional activator